MSPKDTERIKAFRLLLQKRVESARYSRDSSEARYVLQLFDSSFWDIVGDRRKLERRQDGRDRRKS